MLSLGDQHALEESGDTKDGFVDAIDSGFPSRKVARRVNKNPGSREIDVRHDPTVRTVNRLDVQSSRPVAVGILPGPTVFVETVRQGRCQVLAGYRQIDSYSAQPIEGKCPRRLKSPIRPKERDTQPDSQFIAPKRVFGNR